MRAWAFIVLVAVVIVSALAIVLAFSGTKPRVVYEVSPETIDKELADVYRAMPAITAQTATFAAATSVGVRLSHDYGAAANYRTVVSWITNGGASFDLRAVNIDGDSVQVFRTGANNGSVSLVTFPVGPWGR